MRESGMSPATSGSLRRVATFFARRTFMLDLVFLRTFLAIHRSGSITKAAKALHLTQPAVSQHLKALEVQIGAKLFRRNPRGVVPTPAAEELSMRIGQHLDALQAVGEEFVHGQ